LKANRRFGANYRLYLQGLFHAGLLLGLFFEREEGGSMFPETPVDFQRTTRRYIPDELY
jgi:hypothetical protein